ncbi:MAG: acetyl-CoA carboxylase biotin carboxyl carrier protein [Acidobacteriota bacterium]|nr:acetyl-CoA carboxylase biotin carboxyl carrier protein [Acidobacteriota bacterium]
MSSKIDLEEINKIIKLLEERNLAEFELEVEGFKIKISRNAQVVYAPANPPAPSFQPPARSDGNGGMPHPIATPPAEPKGDVHYVTSPIVGTFYRAPSPSSPPFVDVDEPVKKQQTLCIVEAMKLMNEIECDVDGVVKEIFVENGKPVEYGQKLFAIVPGA